MDAWAEWVAYYLVDEWQERMTGGYNGSEACVWENRKAIKLDWIGTRMETWMIAGMREWRRGVESHGGMWVG